MQASVVLCIFALLGAKLGVDYSIELTQRASGLSVFAIHGGAIEPGTDAFASAVAAKAHSLYVLRGSQRYGRILHVTSTSFDEPSALALAKRSRVGISIHTYLDEKVDRICVGGGNRKLVARFLEQARAFAAKTGVLVDPDCPGLSGVSPKNLVNLCLMQGLQLEFSTRLMSKLEADKWSFKKWVQITQMVADPRVELGRP